MSKSIKLTSNFVVTKDANVDFNNQLKQLKIGQFTPEIDEWASLFEPSMLLVGRDKGGFGYSELMEWRDLETIEHASYEQLLRALNCSKAYNESMFASPTDYTYFLKIEESIIKRFNEDYAELQKLVINAHQAHNAVKQNQQEGNVSNLSVN